MPIPANTSINHAWFSNAPRRTRYTVNQVPAIAPSTTIAAFAMRAFHTIGSASSCWATCCRCGREVSADGEIVVVMCHGPFRGDVSTVRMPAETVCGVILVHLPAFCTVMKEVSHGIQLIVRYRIEIRPAGTEERDRPGRARDPDSLRSQGHQDGDRARGRQDHYHDRQRLLAPGRQGHARIQAREPQALA